MRSPPAKHATGSDESSARGPATHRTERASTRSLEEPFVSVQEPAAPPSMLCVDWADLGPRYRAWASKDASGGVSSQFSGVGGGNGTTIGGSTAIGNSLNVVVQGNHNTVIVNSTQVNNGNVNAGTNLNTTPRNP